MIFGLLEDKMGWFCDIKGVGGKLERYVWCMEFCLKIKRDLK